MTNPPGTQKHDYGEEFPNYRGFLNRECVTLAELLGSVGYSSYLAGKWHLGGAHKSLWPLQRGFDRFYGCVAGRRDSFLQILTNARVGGFTPVINWSAKVTSTTDRAYYATDAFTDHAIRFIKSGIERSPSSSIFPTPPRIGLIRHMRRI